MSNNFKELLANILNLFAPEEMKSKGSLNSVQNQQNSTLPLQELLANWRYEQQQGPDTSAPTGSPESVKIPTFVTNNQKPKDLLRLQSGTTEGSFDSAFSDVISKEGNYVFNSADPGGETKFGIAKRYHPDLDIKNLTYDQAKKIYKEEYWDKYKFDKMPEKFRGDIFDMFINSPERAAKSVQKVLGVKQDGVIGPQTREFLAKYKGDLGKEAKKEYLVSLTKDSFNTSNYKEHINGWANRYLGVDKFGENKIDLRNKERSVILKHIMNA